MWTMHQLKMHAPSSTIAIRKSQDLKPENSDQNPMLHPPKTTIDLKTNRVLELSQQRITAPKNNATPDTKGLHQPI